MSRVSQAEAARTMNVARSTISRWVKKNPALADENGKVSVDDLRAYQRDVVNPANQTKVKGANPAPKVVASQPGAELNDHRARKERATAAAAELDLAERLGKTVSRDEVEAAAAEAGEVLKNTAMSLVRDRAEAIAVIEDVRATERALEALVMEVLAAGAEALAKAAGQEEADHAA